MKKQLLLAISTLLLLTACGGVKAPEANEEVSKRPSIVYQPSNLGRMQMMYPITVGILKHRDKRALPFYNNQHFFVEDEMEGLQRMSYLELKKSGLFSRVKMIPESAPQTIDTAFLKNMHTKYGVEMILVLDVTEFNLFRTKQGKALDYWSNSSRKDYAGGAFTMKLSASMVGQLIYYNGGYMVWSGDATREDMIGVKDGALTDSQMSSLTKRTLQTLYRELKRHIATTGQRMGKS